MAGFLVGKRCIFDDCSDTVRKLSFEVRREVAGWYTISSSVKFKYHWYICHFAGDTDHKPVCSRHYRRIIGTGIKIIL